MTNNLQKGKLKRWNDDKGFGFIASADERRDIFLHVSALKRMGRRPTVGDIIIYQVHTDNDGKTRAVNAKIEGVSEVKPRLVRKNVRKQNKSNWFSKSLPVALVVLLGSIAFNKFFTHNELHEKSAVSISSYAPKEGNNENYSCAGKMYCWTSPAKCRRTSIEASIFFRVAPRAQAESIRARSCNPAFSCYASQGARRRGKGSRKRSSPAITLMRDRRT